MVDARRISCVDDAHRFARRTLPRVVADYIDGGADGEVTMAENLEGFRHVAFRPHMATGVLSPTIATTVLGVELALPVLLAPCGLVRLVHPDGALGVARAAARAGTVSVLSTVAGATPEDVGTVAGAKWFQLYAAGGRGEADALLERAARAGFGALVVTIDTPALGNRLRDIRNGVQPPLRLDRNSAVRLGPGILARPRWTWRMWRDGVRMVRGGGGSEGVSVPARRLDMAASPFTWDDVAWMRSRWEGALVVKGVLSAPDARRAVDHGADAVIVSNHGGRQLDGAPATMRVLAEVVDEVGAGAEVLVDGGVRWGADVVKALALGARATLVGRPYVWGLAAAGERGVERVLEVLATEMRRTLTLLGCPSVGALDRTWLQRPSA